MTSLIDAVTAKVAPSGDWFLMGEVPDKPEFPYGVVGAVWSTAHTYTLNARHSRRRGQIALQAFGRVGAGAAELMDAAVALLLDEVLDIAGWDDATGCRLLLPPTIVRESDPENTGVIDITAVLTLTAIPAIEEES